ncbi:MAG: hypothetical protein GY786_01350 [Proteobacteria bacterium]|nr:hypothetical protein [Pseudomonadota bacterium]
MKIKIVVLLLTLFGFGIDPGISQESSEQVPDNEAPQILTSDLVRKQVVEEATLDVSFVIVDDDNIDTVLINGTFHEFEKGNTISIAKQFTFQPGKTLITVVAIDEAGNRREKSFLVGYGEEGAQALDDSDKEEAPYKLTMQAGLSLEADSNPTNDISSPVKIGDLDLQGVISDSGQPDNKKSIRVLAALTSGSLSGYVGLTKSDYDKSTNSSMNTQTLFAGGNYTLTQSKTLSIPISLMIVDINAGDNDFSQNISIGPGVQFNSEDNDGFYVHNLGVDITTMAYADSSKSAGSQTTLYWDYNSLDKEKLDNFRFLLSTGSAATGSKESENSYLGFDMDWTNRWESGLNWDLGFGLAKLDYANDIPLTAELGETRLDFLIRFSNGLGWAFSPEWNLVYNYRYLFNLSNKTPYVRIVTGLTINGAF